MARKNNKKKGGTSKRYDKKKGSKQKVENTVEENSNIKAEKIKPDYSFKDSYKTNNQEQPTTFIVPYSFIPLEDKITLFSVDEKNEERNLTGYIDCTLTPRTDIFIPNTSYEHCLINKSSHKSYLFYHYANIEKPAGANNYSHVEPDAPVIPASEIRGMIRSVYETITNSCLSVLDDKQFTNHSTDFNKPGLIIKKDDEYKLYKAISFKINDDNKKDFLNKMNSGEFLGDSYLYKGNLNSVGDKNIYEFSKDKYITTLQSEDIDSLKECIDSYYNNPKINKHHHSHADQQHHGYTDLYQAIENYKHPVPVYYTKIKSSYYLSPVSIGRRMYKSTQHSVAGSHIPCQSRVNDSNKNFCYACQLFGTLTDDKKMPNLTTRVRFTDAFLLDDHKACYRAKSTLKPQYSPNFNCLEFYTTVNGKNEPSYWTADYYYNKKNKINFWDQDNQLQLAGRKYYWHNLLEKAYLDSDATANENNITVRPLSAIDGKSKINVFNFKVYFEDISQTELDHLIYALNLGGNKNEQCHKIGRGRPLGLGSIKVKVNGLYYKEFIIDKDNKVKINNTKANNTKDEFNIEKPTLCNDETLKALINVTNLKRHKKKYQNISYPFSNKSNVNNNIAHTSIEWFKNNRPSLKKVKKFEQKLKNINDVNQELDCDK